MSKVIAGVYEIEEEIGAGGGGIVYFGRHTRLEKNVVLKADKRRLSTNRESLRREVDMLKNLRQTYIPQVYDFIEEDGVVYTVMDYIEGESFDKVLAKGQTIKQADLVKWAWQLLEALKYLHEQPPYGILHGDIKPANIMLRPNGDVCLIDFNIALALGEDGAVKVGFSRGYASPEHYGADYIRRSRSAAASRSVWTTTNRQNDNAIDKGIVGSRRIDDADSTLILKTDEQGGNEDNTEATLLLNKEQGDLAKSVSCKNDGTLLLDSKGASLTSGEKSIMLDARSDIYSLGATLYHIISGKQPAQDARDVVPLTEDVCSRAIIEILQKAMNPQPDERYQSADEMLQAFRSLYRNDPRAKKYRKRVCTSVAGTIVLFLTGIGSLFVGMNQMKQREASLVLAEYSSNALAEGDVDEAVRYALEALPMQDGILSGGIVPQAQKALTDALGVYDLGEKYESYTVFDLKGAPFDLTLSPSGKKLAVVYAYEVSVFDVENKKAIVSLPIAESAYSDVVFVDEHTIIYAGNEGVTSYDLEQQKEKWVVSPGTCIAISEDKSKVATINGRSGFAEIFATVDGAKLGECDFGNHHLKLPENDIFADAKDIIFALSEDGSKLAVSYEDGSLNLFYWMEQQEPVTVCDASSYERMEGGFSKGYFAYTAYRSGKSVFRVVDVDNKAEIGGYDSQEPYRLKVIHDKVLLSNMNVLVSFDLDSKSETELAFTNSYTIKDFAMSKGDVIVNTEDGYILFYNAAAKQVGTMQLMNDCDFLDLSDSYVVLANRNEPSVRVMKKESHEETVFCTYDPRFVHDEARISMDGQTSMLFNYKEFAIFDIAGTLVSHVELPDAESIYDQQFRRDENQSYLEVTWYDGTVRNYEARTGTLLSQDKKEKPDKSLYEEFFTEKYKILSYLHEPAEVYDKESGKKLATLEKESYLTYVTEIPQGLITEYVSSGGERYGLLLDDNLDTIAYLPDLCDVWDGSLVFDDNSGNLRKSSIYALKDLTELGEKILSEK